MKLWSWHKKSVTTSPNLYSSGVELLYIR